MCKCRPRALQCFILSDSCVSKTCLQRSGGVFAPLDRFVAPRNLSTIYVKQPSRTVDGRKKSQGQPLGMFLKTLTNNGDKLPTFSSTGDRGIFWTISCQNHVAGGRPSRQNACRHPSRGLNSYDLWGPLRLISGGVIWYIYRVVFTFGSCIHVFMYIHSYIDSIYILSVLV